MTFEDLKDRLRGLDTIDAFISIGLLDDWVIGARDIYSFSSPSYRETVRGFLTGLCVGNIITVSEKHELMRDIYIR